MADEKDMTCPDPNEVVTRAILAAYEEKRRIERVQERTAFRIELSEDIARQLGAYEEQRKIDREQEYGGLEDSILRGVQGLLDERLMPVRAQIDDHDTRLVRLEARPAGKRVRARTTKRPTSKRKPK